MSSPFFKVDIYSDSNPSELSFTPENNDNIPDEFLDFKLDVESTVSTTNSLFNSQEDNRKYFLKRLLYAAKIGLEGSKADLLIAKRTLIEIKNEVTTKHWMAARAKIVKSYALSCFLFSLGLFISFFLLPESIKYFSVLLIGSCIGSLLSLIIRTNELNFWEIKQYVLGVKTPYLRCFSICLLSFVVALLLSVGFFQFDVGGVSSQEIETDYRVSLAVGIVFGFSEKLLLAKISEKNRKFFN